MRRLGDLRLECRVATAIVQQQLSCFAKVTVNALMKTSDWCAAANVKFGMRAGVRLSGASIRAGARTQDLDTQEWS